MSSVGYGNGKQYCILFYKYHPLTDNPDVLETYRHTTETLCASLHLTGRILIGLSNDGEGINGTLAGTKVDLDAYVDCMLGKDVGNIANLDQRRKDAVVGYRTASKQFFEQLNLPELFLSSPNDFKWSSSSDDNTKEGENWFPDLNIKIVKEIISSGGAFSDITTKDTSVGYMTPREWHKEIKSLVEKQNGKNSDGNGDTEEDIETVLIDVRNHKECQIGSFAPGVSIDPQTKTFAQFPKWVKENSAETEASKDTPAPSLLNNKRILMYCTGGIRCEKASAYIRQVVPQNKGIYHLKGGIHKYLEEFGHDALENSKSNGGDKQSADECLFVGKNFVFDRRGALDAKGHGLDVTSKDQSSPSSCAVIGKCQYCSDPYDTFLPGNVCTVCREPILVCEKCQDKLQQEQKSLRSIKKDSNDSQDDGKTQPDNCQAEYHCEDHFHLKSCYFTSLHGFSVIELERQVKDLQILSKDLESLGRKGKQKRRTLRKQIDKIEACIKEKLTMGNGDVPDLESAAQCRHCGSSSCKSDCWGFHGGNARMMNKNKLDNDGKVDGAKNGLEVGKHKQRTRLPSNQRPAKKAKRQSDISEIQALQLCNPPSHHRNDASGLRVPPPVIRVLHSGVKGRWCGKTVKWLLSNDFGESLKGTSEEDRCEILEQLIAAGLVRINGVQVSNSEIVLRNMDTVERIVHWHEPPVIVPAKIPLTQHALPEGILPASREERPLLYCIDKPSSVPIYPSGPYYANSLLMMIEAQERLPPKSLIPLHRIDRATSGVLLCANTPSIARVVQGQMAANSNNNEKSQSVRKLYLARVSGKFPADSSENPTISQENDGIASLTWSGEGNDVIEVDAPIAVQLETKNDVSKDDANTSNSMMHRVIRSDGKQSISRFKLVSYDPKADQSLVSCAPITGRGHQLRVHLQLIGFPIHNDVEYGGAVDAEDMKANERLSAQSMSDIKTQMTDVLHEDSATAQEVASAMKQCRCCSGGIDGICASFNSAQLLGCGHAIDLHALKYCISLEQKESTKSNEVRMEFSTELPVWASSFEGIEPSGLTWLK